MADLTSTTRDGIEIRPLYTDGPARPEAARAAVVPERTKKGWDVRTRHIVASDAGGRVGAAGAGSGAEDGDDAGLGAADDGFSSPGVGGDSAGGLGDSVGGDSAGGLGDSVGGDSAGGLGDSVGGLDALRRRIEDDLAGGATSVELEVGASVTIDELSSVLAGVDLSKTPLALAPHASLGTATALGALASRTGGGLAAGSSLGLDPLGEWARSGRRVGVAPATERGSLAGASQGGVSQGGVSQGGVGRRGTATESIVAEFGAAAGEALGLGPGARAFTVDAVRYADAGATEAQALGWATATGVAYMRALVEAGLSVDAAAGMIGFRMAATADQFVTIAALRAARVMWARVVTASGGSQQAARQYQHAVTATHMYSRRDPWVNLLRGAAAALAAGVAGADAVTVLPFDHASGAVDADGALGRRLARNTQLLLLEESHLARSSDPAGGSFYVESLTERLAAEGWRVFQDVEASGGMEAAISSGGLAAAIEESWRSRLGALRTRSEALTGVSEFALPEEPARAGRADPEPAWSESDPQGLVDPEGAEGATGLPVRRLAGPFEELRDAADRHQGATGERPAVWVAALGATADHSDRTAWTQNLLAAGGIEARGAAGVDSPIAAAADFAESGLVAAVITGTDDMYRLRGSATASALAESGATVVAVACDPDTPAELRAELQSAGVNDLWHDGIDVATALERLHHTLGIA